MNLFLNPAPIKIKPVRRFFLKIKASWCEDAVPGWGECTPTTSSQACCKCHRQHRWAPQHTTELAVRAVLSSRSRQCMSEDEVKIKSRKYRRCFQANCRQVSSYNCLIWWVVEILTMLKSETEVLLPPEVPGANGQSLLLGGPRAGWVWCCFHVVPGPSDRVAAFGSGWCGTHPQPCTYPVIATGWQFSFLQISFKAILGMHKG